MSLQRSIVGSMIDALRKPIGAILAGGRSKRMGGDKALTDFNGRPMIAHVAAAIKKAGCEPLVVGRASVPIDIPSRADDLPGRAGPAAGLATALRLAAGRPVFLVATDQPLLRHETVRRLLLLEGEAVLPFDAGSRQATCAVYRAGCLDPLMELMAGTPSPPLQALLDLVATREVLPAEWSTWGETGTSWWSLDRPEDVAEAEAWLRQSPEPRARNPDDQPTTDDR
jgi:molybdopterin-guanine dinucleotide biosynthesis protein A